jgi:hypothetical protein
MNSKATGRDIALAILDNMRESAEPLLYHSLVPSHYDVYLHREDYDRLSGIFPRIREECHKALENELAGLNRKGFSLLSGLKKPGAPKYEAAEKQWSVQLYVDEDEDLAPGDILVDSRLALPQSIEYGVGTKTQRSETVRSGGETRNLRKYKEDASQDEVAIARISYRGKEGQDREFLMISQEISVGRGGQSDFCDLVVEGPADVSRQHFYLRIDPATKEFFIQDVSRFGTEVNGKQLAPKEWVRLPSKATIKLAGKVALEFQQL